MKGKLLFLCTGHFDLYKIFEEGFKQHSGCEVTTILYRDYKYRNTKEKVQNFLSKTFLKKNLKKFWGSRESISAIKETDSFDYVFVICPELLFPEHLDYVTKKAKTAIAYYWDGFDHFPAYFNTLQYFSRRFSFDPVDVKKYDLEFITNFYFYEGRNTQPEYDLFFLGSYDSRYPTIASIVSVLENTGNKVVVKLLSNDAETAGKYGTDSIEFIDRFIPFEETKELMKKSRIILDIHKKIQHGLSFRVFEAMGLGKKLITTNPDVVNYDFYDPNNIFVWTEGTTAIPESFLNTPYRELPEALYKKYSREHWVKTVLGIEGK